jgi:hypothetical protein
MVVQLERRTISLERLVGAAWIIVEMVARTSRAAKVIEGMVVVIVAVLESVVRMRRTPRGGCDEETSVIEIFFCALNMCGLKRVDLVASIGVRHQTTAGVSSLIRR